MGNRFKDLGIAWGNSIIGFCAVAFIPIPYVWPFSLIPPSWFAGECDADDVRFLLIRYGSWLREHSKISLHDSDLLEQPEAPIDSTRLAGTDDSQTREGVDV